FGAGRLGGGNARGRVPRLGVIDYASVDARRRLILVRRDNVEHLLMIGGPTDVVVEANIVRAVAANPRDAVVPRAPTMEMPRAMPLPETSNGGSWPLQPEPAAPAPAPRAVPRYEPLADDSAPGVPLQPAGEPPAKPQRDTLAALADELSARPAPPVPARNRPPAPPRKSSAEARAEPRPEPRPEPRAEPRMPETPPAPAATPVDASADQSLAEMAHRLEAALRKPGTPAAPGPAPAAPQAATPAAEPAPPPPPPRAARQAELKPASPRPDAKPNKPTTLYDNLEQEMASLLGRPTNKN